MTSVARMFGQNVVVFSVVVPLFGAGCVAITANPVDKLEEATNSALVVSANFPLDRPTGWTNESGAPIAFSVARASGTSGSLQCSYGMKEQYGGAVWSACESGSFAPAAVSGRLNSVKRDNGTFVFEARLLDKDGAVVGSYAKEFYVHPSLNAVPSCADTISDDDYFAAAASYLDMSTPFGAANSIQAPFNRLDFTGGVTGAVNSVSLRKRYAANGDQTLMILRRTYPKWTWTPNDHSSNAYQSSPNACKVTLPYERQATRSVSYRSVPDGHGGYENYLDAYESLRTVTGLAYQGLWISGWNWNAGIVSDINAQGDPNRYFNRSWRDRLNTRGVGANGMWYQFQDLVTHGTLASNPMSSFNTGRGMQCDAVVFNSQGRGLCFHSGALAGPGQLRNVRQAFASQNVYRAPNTQSYWGASLGKPLAMRNKIVNDGSNSNWQNYQNLSPVLAEDDADHRGLFLNP